MEPFRVTFVDGASCGAPSPPTTFIVERTSDLECVGFLRAVTLDGRSPVRAWLCAYPRTPSTVLCVPVDSVDGICRFVISSLRAAMCIATRSIALTTARQHLSGLYRLGLDV